jgi:hypothetical protein
VETQQAASLRLPAESGNPAIDLISKVVLYGKEIGYNVVLEAIISKKLYGNMLKNLIAEYIDTVHVFYMDVSFEETLRRHDTKQNKVGSQVTVCTKRQRPPLRMA